MTYASLLTLVFVLGLMGCAAVLGYILGTKRGRDEKFHAGNIVLDFSDPLKDVLSMELECSITEMLAQDELYFKVVNKGSQEKPLA